MPYTQRPQSEVRGDKKVAKEVTNLTNFVREKGNHFTKFAADVRELMVATTQKGIQVFNKNRDHLLSEMIFLKSRDAAQENSQIRMEASDLIAADDFKLETILSATDPAENKRLYDEISTLRTIYINQLITLDHIPHAGFHEQRGLARIELIRFLLRKTDMCYRKGILLNENNIDELFLRDLDLRLDRIQNEIRQLVTEAFALSAHEPKTLEDFQDELAQLLSPPSENIPPPKKAPELYIKRENKKETPADFIKRVYKEWLGRGLLRPHIKALDLSLYQNLYKRGVPQEFDTLLPKASGRPVQEIFDDASSDLEQRRKEDRKRSRRRYHENQQP